MSGELDRRGFPAGVGRIDRGFPGSLPSEMKEWLRVMREVIWENPDLTPEMLARTRVADLKTWWLAEVHAP
jgi:hypothetical protein